MTVRRLYELWANNPPVQPRSFVEFIALAHNQSRFHNKVWKNTVPMVFQLAWDDALSDIVNFNFFDFCGLSPEELQKALDDVPSMPRQGDSYLYPDTHAGSDAWSRDNGHRTAKIKTINALLKIHKGDLAGVNELDNVQIPLHEWVTMYIN